MQPGRSRRLEGDEAERILKHADPFMRDFITAMIETGCRLGELRQLQFTNVHDDHLHILACKAKDKEDRYIPVVDATFKALLQRRRLGPDGTELPSGAYAFGTPFGEVLSREQLNRAWRVTCAAANVVGLHLHDLRAEAASIV